MREQDETKSYLTILRPRFTFTFFRMFGFDKLLSSVLLAVAFSSPASAFQDRSATHPSTHRTREIRRNFKLESYHPPATFEVSIAFMEIFPCTNVYL